MTSRTVAGSVECVSAPPAGVAELEAELEVLRQRFPGALFQRYLALVPRVAEGVYVAPTAALARWNSGKAQACGTARCCGET